MGNISIKWQRCLVWGAVLLCCGQAGAAELLGSPNPEIKKNFNQLLSTNACQGCNLSGAVLDRLNLADADLEGADLSGARLNGASLAGANLHNANLRGAWLGGADLSGANLLGADLAGADFTFGGRRETEVLGQQAVDSAQHTVNSTLDNLFSVWQQQEAGQPAQSAPTAGPAPAAEQKQAEEAGPAVQPQKEISILFAPFEPGAEEKEARRNVDEVPVLQHDSLLLEADEKKSAQAAGQRQPAPPERVNEIVLDQVWLPLVAAPSPPSGPTGQTGQSCPRPPAAQPKN